jgi:hypothetical protein
MWWRVVVLRAKDGEKERLDWKIVFMILVQYALDTSFRNIFKTEGR